MLRLVSTSVRALTLTRRLRAADRLRFDFTRSAKPTAVELQTLERWVNKAAEAGTAVNSAVMPKQEAVNMKAVRRIFH